MQSPDKLSQLLKIAGLSQRVFQGTILLLVLELLLLTGWIPTRRAVVDLIIYGTLAVAGIACLLWFICWLLIGQQTGIRPADWLRRKKNISEQ